MSALSVVIAHALRREISSTKNAETVEPEVKHQASDPPPRLRKGLPGSFAELRDQVFTRSFML